MPEPTTTNIGAVLSAAEALLAARADGMLTAAEWGALERAVAAARPAQEPRCHRCGAEQLGHRVTDPDGRVVCGECGAAYDDDADPGS